jgi:hypothetical protein
MANLLAQAINCDDADRAAKTTQDALGIESDDVVLIASGALPSSASGSKPRPAISRRDRPPPLPAALVRRGDGRPSSRDHGGLAARKRRVAKLLLSPLFVLRVMLASVGNPASKRGHC